MAAAYRFPFAELRAAGETLIHATLDPRGSPVKATAAAFIDAPRARVWPVISDVSRFDERVPMIQRIYRERDLVTMKLRFKVALVSFKFQVVTDLTRDEGKWVELRYVSGEPRNMCLHLEVDEPVAGAGCAVHVDVGFDMMSLGPLMKAILANSEIRFGIFPGSAMVILDSMRRAAEGSTT